MPTYVYQCSQCQHRFDLRQGFSDPPQAPCPTCGAEAKRRILPPAIVFKGNGWYSTDHRPSSFDSQKDGEASAPDQAKDTVKETEPAASAPKAEATVERD